VTIFGPDVSSYQNGLDLSRLTAASFVIAKTTEGTYYTDSGYQGWRQQAARLGKPFVWYHFLSGEDAHAQVSHTAANIGDSGLSGMLDVEPAGSFSPTMSQVIAYVDAAHGAGLNLRLLYLPHWYWQQIGSPDLTPLASRGLALISSAYPGGTGGPAQLYPGDSAGGWQPYGGMTPLLYQYTNQAADGGMSLDYNAFRGSVAELAAHLGAPVPPTGGSDMTPDESKQLAEIHQSSVDFANWQFFAPAGREQVPGTHAWRMQSTLDNTNAIKSAVDQLLARQAPVPTIDVAALAAALAPLLQGAVAPTPDQVAAAVVAHLATTLAKG
jgi:hypothetical protein